MILLRPLSLRNMIGHLRPTAVLMYSARAWLTIDRPGKMRGEHNFDHSCGNMCNVYLCWLCRVKGLWRISGTPQTRAQPRFYYECKNRYLYWLIMFQMITLQACKQVWWFKRRLRSWNYDGATFMQKAVDFRVRCYRPIAQQECACALCNCTLHRPVSNKRMKWFIGQ